MSASLVRKALDETTLASEEKFDQLSKVSKKSFKSHKKTKKLANEKVLKQNLKILKALDYKPQSKLNYTETPTSSSKSKQVVGTGSSDIKSKKKKKKQRKDNIDSGFTEDDFEKFEKEYFVTH